MKNKAQSSGYAGDMVRDHDPDRFMAALFFPEDVRADLWTLYAFHHEIAKTREVVTDTHIGLIRLQWWRDAIASIYDGRDIAGHPIAVPLADLIRRRKLNREWFDSMIYAREFDLEDILPGNMSGLLHYADFTQTPLMRLALQITGDDPDDPAVAPVAMAWALAGLLRAVPFHAGQSRCYMPSDLMNREELSTDTLYAARDLHKLAPVVRAARGQAQDLLASAPQSGGRLLRLYRVMADYDLRRLESAGDRVFHGRVRRRGPLFPLILWRSAR